MARIKVGNGETVTTETIVGAGDTLAIDVGGAIVRSGTVPAVRLTGTDAVLRNDGRIAVEGASGAALTGAFTGVLDLTIRNGVNGTIEGDSVAVALSSTTGTTGTVRFTNEGLIDGNAGNAVNLRDLRADSITVRNLAGATITNAGTSDVLRPGHDLLTDILVVNFGTIQAGTVIGASSSGDGIDLQSQDGGVAAKIINREGALIEGGKHAVTGGNAAVIINEADASLIGRNGSGVNFDTELADGDGAVIVINHGLISGQYDGFGDGDGDGVDVDYIVNVRNDGRIEGVGADEIDDFADGIAAGGGRIQNLAGGEIYGDTNGILIDDGDRNGAYAETRIVNAGTITGNTGYGIRLIGDFNDVIVNSGGIVGTGTAAIDAGGGDDRVVNTGTVFGRILLGIGSDTYTGTDGIGFLGGNVVDGGTGDDTIIGGSQSDTITGGLGVDTLAGGGGDDTFVFQAIEDSGTAFGTFDRITDFASGDTIDLSAIDADTTVDGDQAFTIAASGAFSGTPGELVVIAFGQDTAIGADVDGDAETDFTIVIEGVDPSVLAFTL